jgi:PAS domain-containing protein
MAWVLSTARERALALATRMTENLRSTRDELQSTLNAIPDLLFELDPDGRIQSYRPGGADLLAAPAELFEGRLLQDVVGPEAAAGCRAALEAAQRTGHSSGHQFALNLGGQTRWFELSLARKGMRGRPMPNAWWHSRATSPSASSPRHVPTSWHISIR